MKARRTAWAGVAALAAGVVLAAAMVGFARPAVLAGRSNREVADRMLQQRQRSRAGKAPRRNVPGAPSRSPAPAAGPGLASRVRAIEANAAAPQTEAAPSPLFHPGKHATGMTAQEAAEGRPFELTAYTVYEDGISDPDHPVRRSVEAAGVDRLVITFIGVPEARELERFVS